MKISMNHSYEKRYYESLAKQVLETFLPDKYHNLTHSDRPDLRMGDERGIEVTRALDEQTANINGTFKHIVNKHIDSVDIRHINKLEKLGCKLLIKENGIIFGCSPLYGEQIDDKILRIAYSEKNRNYQSSPVSISLLDLFIISPFYNWFEEDVIRGFLQWAHDTGCSIFDNIFVFEYSYLYMYNMRTEDCAVIPAGEAFPEKLKDCCKTAREYSQEADT